MKRRESQEQRLGDACVATTQDYIRRFNAVTARDVKRKLLAGDYLGSLYCAYRSWAIEKSADRIESAVTRAVDVKQPRHSSVFRTLCHRASLQRILHDPMNYCEEQLNEEFLKWIC